MGIHLKCIQSHGIIISNRHLSSIITRVLSLCMYAQKLTHNYKYLEAHKKLHTLFYLLVFCNLDAGNLLTMSFIEGRDVGLVLALGVVKLSN